MEWQPIETAPKDGRYLLLYEKYVYVPFIGYWDRGRWVADKHAVYAEAHDGSYATVESNVASELVLYWMEIPTNPQVES